MKKIETREICEILKYATLTCKQISQITGHSLYKAKEFRLIVLQQYNDKFPYSNGAPVRTDHFVEWYNNPVINKIYNELYDLQSTNNPKYMSANNNVDLPVFANYNRVMNNNLNSYNKEVI